MRCREARPTSEDLDRLAAGGEVVHLKRGARVFSEGDLVHHVWVIRRGTVALGRVANGRSVTLLLLREGDTLGDIPMLLQAPAQFDAVVATDAELVCIPAARLVATLDQSREFAQRWIMWLSGRLSKAHSRLLSLLAGDVRAQVAALLVQEACRGDTIALTHQDLAAMVGAQRSSVTRALDELGCGVSHRHRLRPGDRPRLRRPRRSGRGRRAAAGRAVALINRAELECAGGGRRRRAREVRRRRLRGPVWARPAPPA